VRGDGDVPDVLRVVHQPLALLYDLLASAHYVDSYRKQGQKGAVSRERSEREARRGASNTSETTVFRRSDRWERRRGSKDERSESFGVSAERQRARGTLGRKK